MECILLLIQLLILGYYLSLHLVLQGLFNLLLIVFFHSELARCIFLHTIRRLDPLAYLIIWLVELEKVLVLSLLSLVLRVTERLRLNAIGAMATFTMCFVMLRVIFRLSFLKEDCLLVLICSCLRGCLDYLISIS